MLCYVMLCYVMLCYVMLCYVMLCYVMLCYVMLCYVMLCYVILFYFILCLNIISCAHINNYALLHFYFIRNNMFCLVNKCLRVGQPSPIPGLPVITDGLVVIRYDATANCRRRLS